jgi:hypothetical protein
MSKCIDPAVGDILSSWRYDISGSSPEMRGDLESHFAECSQCRTRQAAHRAVDVALIGITTLSTLAFLLAIAVIHHLEPLRTWAIALHMHQINFALTLQDIAVVGLLVSVFAWVVVALVTPAPTYVSHIALAQAREFRNRTQRKAA